MLKKKVLVYFAKYGKIYSLVSYIISFIVNFKIHLKKKKIFNNYINQKKVEESLSHIINELNENGYYKSSLDSLNLSNKILDLTKKLVNNKGQKTNKNFFDNSYKFDNEDEVTNFALQEKLLVIIARYLKICPTINSIQFITSNSINEKLYSSMNWHLDSHHKKLIKIIFLPFDLTEENGPTHFLDKITTQKIIKKDNYFSAPNYFTDDEFKNIYPNYENKICKLIGKKGDFLIIDTSKCFHMGSRNAKDRHQMFFTYTPVLTFDLESNKNLIKYDKLNKKIEKLLLI
tara:strand:+ start:864 stop:1727 length:864 start_codon:yes stop_codon:yes gene_type:complete